jgi:hypothetical protein
MSGEYPKRLKPPTSSEELLLLNFVAISLALVTYFPLTGLLGDAVTREHLSDSLDLGTSAPYFWIYCFGCIAVAEFLIIRRVRQLHYGNRLLSGGSAIATATIVDHHMAKESGCLSLLMGQIPTGHADYYVVFEFNAVQAEPRRGTMMLEAKVSKAVYERLEPGTTADVQYATQDPRVVLFEAERS